MAKAIDLNKSLQQLRSGAPKRGMFSTLDELIEVSPRENMSPKEWLQWLQTGRILEREGVSFPLKKAELEDTGFREHLEGPAMSEYVDESGRVSRAHLQGLLENIRPKFGETRGVERGVELRGHRIGMDPEGRLDRSQEKFVDYLEDRYRHHSEGATYEENVTRLEGLKQNQRHYPTDTLVWSRTTTHDLPKRIELGSPPIDQGKVRLVEEIQSELHQIGREVGYHDAKRAAELAAVEEELTRLGKAVIESERSRLRGLPLMAENLTAPGARDHGGFAPETIDLLERRDFLKDRQQALLRGVSDAPFKDPKEYGRIELSKQLLNAVENGEDYLALTTGDDQVTRYKEGMTPKKAAGMRHVYDKIYPSVLRALARKFGAEVTEIEVPLSWRGDTRLHTIADSGAEDIDQMRYLHADMLTGDEEDWMMVGGSYGDILAELKTSFPPTAENRGLFEAAERHVSRVIEDIKTIADRDTILEELIEEGSLTRQEVDATMHPEADSKAREELEEWISSRFELRSENEDRQVELTELMDYADDAIGRLEMMYNKFAGTDSIDVKKFPALHITPEVAQRIKKAGVPLYGAAGAAMLGDENPELEELRAYAKGGKVGKLTRRDVLKGIGAAGITALAAGKAAIHKGVDMTDVGAKLKGLEAGIKKPIRDIATTVRKSDFTESEWRVLSRWMKMRKADLDDIYNRGEGQAELMPEFNEERLSIEKIENLSPDQLFDEFEVETLRDVLDDADYGGDHIRLDDITLPERVEEMNVVENLTREFATSREWQEGVRAEGYKAVPEPSPKVQSIFADYVDDARIYEDRMQYSWEDLKEANDLSPAESKELWEMLGGNRGGWQEPGEFAKGGKVTSLAEFLAKKRAKALLDPEIEGTEHLPPTEEFMRINAEHRFRQKAEADRILKSSIEGEETQMPEGFDEYLKGFHAKLDKLEMEMDAKIKATQFEYAPGDRVMGQKFPHEVLYKTVNRKTGEPEYHVRNLNDGAEYVLPERGIVGEYIAPPEGDRISQLNEMASEASMEFERLEGWRPEQAVMFDDGDDLIFQLKDSSAPEGTRQYLFNPEGEIAFREIELDDPFAEITFKPSEAPMEAAVPQLGDVSKSDYKRVHAALSDYRELDMPELEVYPDPQQSGLYIVKRPHSGEIPAEYGGGFEAYLVDFNYEDVLDGIEEVTVKDWPPRPKYSKGGKIVQAVQKMTEQPSRTDLAIAKVNKKVLNDEIEYQMDVDREEPGYTSYHALTDAYDLALDNGDRAVIKAARKVYIELGEYVHVTDEQLSRIQTMGRKKYDFIMDGKKYMWERPKYAEGGKVKQLVELGKGASQKELQHCFDNSFRTMLDLSKEGVEHKLVHATVTNIEGKSFDHSWIELKDGDKVKAIDSGRSLDDPIIMDADKFRSALGVEGVTEYTPEQAMIRGVRTKHYGPWGDKKYAKGGQVKNEKLNMLRAAGRSLANQIPFLSEEQQEYWGDIPAHLVGGLASQWSGVNPSTGELEFAGTHAMSKPHPSIASYDMDLYRRLMAEWEADPGVTAGIIDETVALPVLAELWGGTPPVWASEAAERTGATRESIRGILDLEEPVGFPQHLSESLGVMAGQMPVPVGPFKAVANWMKERGPLGAVARWATFPGRAGIEYLSPIIEPKVASYVAGALFGGTIGVATDPGEVPPDIEELVVRAEAGDEEAYEQLSVLYAEWQEEQQATPGEDAARRFGVRDRAGFAGGGKVGALQEMIEKFTKLGDDQRGAPEKAMLKASHHMGGGVLPVTIEHVGDLTHRMSHHAKYDSFYPELVRDKVERSLSRLQHSYGFEREMAENMQVNAEVNGVPLAKFQAQVDDNLQKYADEHRKLTVYNWPQYLGREAAVALGEKRWGDAERRLEALKRILDRGDEEFIRKASELKHPDGFAKGGKVGKLTRRDVLKGLGAAGATALAAGKAGIHKGVDMSEVGAKLKTLEAGIKKPVRDLAIEMRKKDFAKPEWDYISRAIDDQIKELRRVRRSYGDDFQGRNTGRRTFGEELANLERIQKAPDEQYLLSTEQEQLKDLVRDEAWNWDDPAGQHSPNEAIIGDMLDNLDREFNTSKMFTHVNSQRGYKAVPDPSPRVQKIYDEWVRDARIFEDRIEYSVDDLMFSEGEWLGGERQMLIEGEKMERPTSEFFEPMSRKDATDLRKMLHAQWPFDKKTKSPYAKGGKVGKLTRRDVLKGLGASVATVLAAGKAGLHKGTDMAEVGAKLETIKKGIGPGAKAIPRGATFRSVAEHLREKARYIFEETRAETPELRVSEWVDEEFDMLMKDREDYLAIAKDMDEGNFDAAIEKYDNMDTAAREAIYDELGDKELMEARRVLGEAGSVWEMVPIEFHPESKQILREYQRLSEMGDPDKLRKFIWKFEKQGYDLDAKFAKGGKVSKVTRRDVLKGLGASAATALGVGKASMHQGVDMADVGAKLKGIKEGIKPASSVLERLAQAPTATFRPADLSKPLKNRLTRVLKDYFEDTEGLSRVELEDMYPQTELEHNEIIYEDLINGFDAPLSKEQMQHLESVLDEASYVEGRAGEEATELLEKLRNAPALSNEEFFDSLKNSAVDKPSAVWEYEARVRAVDEGYGHNPLRYTVPEINMRELDEVDYKALERLFGEEGIPESIISNDWDT